MEDMVYTEELEQFTHLLNPKKYFNFFLRAPKSMFTQNFFLSSHPSDENRIAQINKYIKEALKYYKPK
jgi:Zn-dependent protease with chaperone function